MTMPSVAPASVERQLASLRRLALAAARPGGPALHAELVRALAEVLDAALVFAAVVEDETRATLLTLAAHLEGRMLDPVRFVLADAPSAEGLGYGAVFGVAGLVDCASCALMASDGERLGVLVAMDRHPIGGGDVAHTEALLKIAAGRLAAEIERGRTEEVLRTTAFAVSGARSATVFDELVRLLATTLRVEQAFIARHDAASPQDLHMLARWQDGQLAHAFRYGLGGTPCETVLAQGYRAYADRLPHRFPDDEDVRAQGIESYAGIALVASDGRRLGVLAVTSRRPLAALDRVEAMLQIVAVRASAEIERLDASEALRRSEASYRAIFEAAEDAIFIHDWNTGRILDVNRRACESFGRTREEFARLSFAEICASMPPHTMQDAAHWVQLAKLDRCPPFEWRRRNKDGTLRWDEVRLKPALIDGRPHVLAFARDITERKGSLAAVQAQEQKYRAIFDGSVDSMVLWTDELRVADVNAAFVGLTGLAREDVVGRHWTERPDRDDMERLLEFVSGALDGRESRAVQRVSRADGSLFDIELRYIPVHIGDARFALGVGRDVTAQLEHERELRHSATQLRASEEQYRAIFNASADALVLRAADFSIVDVNATYESMSGYARAEVLGVNRVIANPQDVAQVIRALHERALGGEPISLEAPFVHRDGRRYELELRGVPILHRGEPHVLYIGRDITHSKRAERALRDSEAQYRAIFNASADALILRDAEFRAVEVNPAFTTLSGYSREELLNSTQVLMSDDPQAMQRHLADHARALAGEVLRFERTAWRKDGQTRRVEVRGTPVSYRGEPHVLYAVRDMTERHAAEQRRVELERQLRQAQKMEAIGQLTGGIAHDFNNILASVIGYLVLAGERAEAMADATLIRQLGQAHLAADRARELIAQMLAFARRQRGDRRVLALAPLLEQTLTLLRATLPSTVTLEVDATAAADAMASVEADAVQIEQVLFNLCINARDAIAGQGRIAVGLRSVDGAPTWHCASCRAQVEGGSWAVLTVQDDGPGIEPEVVDRIFDPFFSTKSPGKGSGMGLAMVHGIVHDHGGHLELHTAPGRGACFALWLPRSAAAAAIPASASAAPTPASALRGRVLVVEDDPMVGNFLAERLESWGLEVLLKRDSSAADAWLHDSANTIDLMITDQTMPQLTGLQLAARTRAHRPGLPVVLVSGNASAFDVEELARCGVSSALPKPIDGERLRAALRRLLPSAGAMRGRD